MSLLELFRASADSIRAHKLRSFLTLLGIIIGVTAVVGVASVISGVNGYVQEKLITLAPDTYVVTKFGIIQSRDAFFEALKRPDLTPHDFETLRSTLTLIDAIGADVTTGAAVKFRDRRLPGVTVHGCTPNFADLAGKNLEVGRWFVEGDEKAAQNVAIIGWDVKDELFPHLDPLGRTMTIAGVPFRVIGVVTQMGRVLGQTEDNHVYTPITTFRKTWGTHDSIDLVLKAKGGVPGLEASIDEVRAVVRALRHTPFKSADPFGVVTNESLQTLWRQISTAIFVLTFLVAAVSLGVGGIVITNIMLVGVVERTREIGVRLAMGARKRDIRRQFLLEAALLSTAGGVIGLGVGALIRLMVTSFFNFPAQLTGPIIAMGLGLSTAVGIVAGYLPARNASNLVVVDALRDES